MKIFEMCTVIPGYFTTFCLLKYICGLQAQLPQQHHTGYWHPGLAPPHQVQQPGQ